MNPAATRKRPHDVVIISYVSVVDDIFQYFIDLHANRLKTLGSIARDNETNIRLMSGVSWYLMLHINWRISPPTRSGICFDTWYVIPLPIGSVSTTQYLMMHIFINDILDPNMAFDWLTTPRGLVDACSRHKRKRKEQHWLPIANFSGWKH